MSRWSALFVQVRNVLRPWARRSHLSSTLLALAGYLVSMSPSLLPRSWYIQGAVAGISALFGYAVGRLIELAVIAVARLAELKVTMSDTARSLILWGWPALLIAIVLLTPPVTVRRHQRTAEIVGTSAPTELELLGATIFAAVVFALLMGLWQGITGLVGWISRQLSRGRLESRVPRWVAQTIATVVVLSVLTFATDRFLIDPFAHRAARAAHDVNALGLSDQPPESPLRSGSPESNESWASLGHAGRDFVTAGPTQEEIAEVTGQPAHEPIRVYAGLAGNRTLADTAAAVVAELERTGAFEREAILMLVTTGTGWVNEWVPSSFEFLTGGDSAIAAMQYSTLPSPLALLESAALPPEAGRAMITAVEEAVNALPEDSRPRLFVSGESLGAYGANAAFESLDDLVARLDGAIFTGTPGFTPLHQKITDSRVVSSTEALPVVDDGRHVRFASKQDELTADQWGRGLGPWEFPRVVYLQHRSDPVVWWSPELLVRSPDWLNETRLGSPAEQMSWAPFVTFWQVSADLVWAVEAPPGEGHRYAYEVVPAMAAVLGDDPDGDYSAIEAAIEAKDPTLNGESAP